MKLRDAGKVSSCNFRSGNQLDTKPCSTTNGSKRLAQKANLTLSSEAQIGPVFSCPDLLLLSLKPMSSFPVNPQAGGHLVNRGV